MKKKYILFALVSILGFASCSSINNNDAHKDNPVIENFDLNQVLLKELNDNEVLLNLTVNGLYNGEKGLSSEDYYLENYVIANLNVGDDLPTSEITSTVADCEFTSWQYATSGGELAFVSKVQEGQKYYQAYFTYLGEGQDDETIGGDGNLSSEQPLEDRTIYFKNNAGWSTVNLYAWNNNGRSNGSWPGLAMTYNEAIDLYTYELSPIYTNVIFNNGSEQTADLKTYEEVNTYIVNSGGSVSYGWYENGSIKPVEVVIPVLSDYYIRGTMNGWGTDNSLTKVDDNTYTITIDLTSGDNFKFATSDWSWECKTLTGSAASNFSNNAADNNNLQCNVSGNYTFTLYVSSATADVVKN